MEVRAVTKYVRVQPRKVRIVADQIRGKYAAHSAALLRYHTSKGAQALHKTLVSAIANAGENLGIPPEALKIRTIMVDEGPRLKRMTAKAMGRGARIIKKTSHITVILEDAEPVRAVKPHGTKAKVRPTLAPAPAKGKKGAKSAKADVPQAEEVAEVVETPVVETEVVAEATPVETSEAPVTEAPAGEEESK